MNFLDQLGEAAQMLFWARGQEGHFRADPDAHVVCSCQAAQTNDVLQVVEQTIKLTIENAFGFGAPGLDVIVWMHT